MKSLHGGQLAAQESDSYACLHHLAPKDHQQSAVPVPRPAHHAAGTATAGWTATPPTPSPRAAPAVPKKPRGRRAAVAPRIPPVPHKRPRSARSAPAYMQEGGVYVDAQGSRGTGWGWQGEIRTGAGMALSFHHGAGKPTCGSSGPGSKAAGTACCPTSWHQATRTVIKSAKVDTLI